MKNKNIMYSVIALIVIVGIVLIAYFNNSNKNPVENTQTGTSTAALPGEHCGGNIRGALSCTVGYHCAAEPGSHLPFGDVGGVCVQD